jgi:hypothetical protein
MVTRRVHRRGFALVDAIIGGALLALAPRVTPVRVVVPRRLDAALRGEGQRQAAVR